MFRFIAPMALACVLFGQSLVAHAQDIPIKDGTVVLTPKANEPTTHVTDEEMRLIAAFENLPLYVAYVQGQYDTSHPVHYGRGRVDGCIVGFGYSLWQRKKDDVLHTLKQVMPEKKARKFLRFVGLGGEVAKKACPDHKAGLPQFTAKESWDLLRLEVQHRKARVIRKAEEEGVYDKLVSGVLAVLVALDYQTPKCVTRAERLWERLANDNFAKAAENIAKCRTPAKSRREAETKYFKRSLQLAQMAD